MTAPGGMRLDKWLWQARFFKSRSLSAAQVADGRIRINGQPVSKSATLVRPGDVLTFAQGTRIRVVRVCGTSVRRGPAAEAQMLYDDLDAADSAPQRLA
ncbi:heat shock protein Hsp15 [Gemmobacter megaterium]|uniref:Heat shock protein Hsp15 n=1 Tax=Gemmobacter megaterium TaxID=1086013 RepID=A0A1N7P8Q8_9RHOB|nr:RNA-binding S4 domain-containing protein [Gemmobacter megaterium]GGE19816.1 heat-shock protein Hsp15 [Gemmobacter megaterium]SIT06984.1 heat shock protein Hsp15 [Gemmobacter megaterium]